MKTIKYEELEEDTHQFFLKTVFKGSLTEKEIDYIKNKSCTEYEDAQVFLFDYKLKIDYTLDSVWDCVKDQDMQIVNYIE